MLCKYYAGTTANSSSGTATPSIYGTTLNVDVATSLISFYIVETATNGRSIFIAKDIKRTTSCDCKGGTRRYEDARVANVEALDLIIRTTDY